MRSHACLNSSRESSTSLVALPRPGATSRAFTFQTLDLILGSLNGEDDPAFTVDDFPLSYGVVALTIFAVGFGPVALGHLLRDRRTARRERPVGVAA